MLTPGFWRVLVCMLSFWCRADAQDECKDVADEEVRSNQAQSMLQRQVQQQKLRLFTGASPNNVVIRQVQQPWQCAGAWPTQTGTNEEKCENGNQLNDGNEYLYNTGASLTIAGACGIAGCECCVRPKTAVTTTTVTITTVTITTTPSTWSCAGAWPTQTGTEQEKCENGNQLNNGNEYLYNTGATLTVPGACGFAGCACCTRKLPTTTVATTTVATTTVATTTATITTVAMSTTSSTWQCAGAWPTQTGTPEQKCENGNQLNDGNEYLYNTGATVTAAGACGIAGCECCVRPTTTTTLAVPQPDPIGCPAACHSPACIKGARRNGGVPLDVNGKCNYHCSMEFSGTRYCGTGSDYTTGNSVDCSGCAVGQHVLAAYGAMRCPTGYAHITDSQACQGSLTIHGTQFLWGGGNHCRNQWWPKAGCFTYDGEMYFSTCGSERPLSTSLHNAVCTKLDGNEIPDPPPAPTGCPAECHSPACIKGAWYNDGVPLDVNGKCNYHCSREFSGTRYCGIGSEYTSIGSVDCSGCAVDHFIIAADSAQRCPTGYVPLNDLEACKDTLTIHGVKYTWSGPGGVGCRNQWWPREGCFTYMGEMYFSTCNIERALSTWQHNGICERIP